MPRIVSAISFSSSCAGTTTATRLPSSTARRLGRAADDSGGGLPHERGDQAEDQSDQGGDDDRVAAAARGRLRGDGRVDHLRRLDLLRQSELLLVRGELVDDRQPLLDEAVELTEEDQLLSGREAGAALDRRLELPGCRVDRCERPLLAPDQP